jgi:hypothetical protein
MEMDQQHPIAVIIYENIYRKKNLIHKYIDKI